MAARAATRKKAPAKKANPSTRAATRVARFFPSYLRHTKGRWAGHPFTLEPWQRDEIIAPLFGTLDKRNLRQYREALIGMPRKNGKSELASGFALYGLIADGYLDARTGEWVPEMGAEVYSVAGSKPQARIVFEQAKSMVHASPFLSAHCKIYRDAIEVPETNSVYRVLSADARLAHGYNPSMAIIDELHVHPNGELYEALKTGTAARMQPLIISITTAGWDRKSIAYKLYDQGKKGTDPRFFFRWWEAPEGSAVKDTKAWRAANPARWVTVDFLRGQLRSGGVPEPVFRRLHLNQWTGWAQRWIAMDAWDACDADPEIPAGGPIYVAVDAAPKRDTTAVAIVHRDVDGVHHVKVVIREADRTLGHLDFDELEDLLRSLARDYDVRSIVVDPYVMFRSMVTLAQEGLPVLEYPQSDSRMIPASMNLYDLVLEERLRHGGDPELRAQSDVAAIRENARGWRLVKAKSTLPVDGLVALAMACHQAEQAADENAGEVNFAVADTRR